jgi:hypothetical protein
MKQALYEHMNKKKKKKKLKEIITEKFLNLERK